MRNATGTDLDQLIERVERIVVNLAQRGLTGDAHDVGRLIAAARRADGTPAEGAKDHEVRELVNTLRDVAIQYRDTQQLRSRIQDAILPLLPRFAQRHLATAAPADGAAEWVVKHYTGADWPVIKRAGIELQCIGADREEAESIAATLNRRTP